LVFALSVELSSSSPTVADASASTASALELGAASASADKVVQRLRSDVSAFSEEAAGADAEWDAECGLLLSQPAAADEERQYGRVPRRLYGRYARSCGLLLTAAYLVVSLAWQTARVATDYWLQRWTVVNQVPINPSRRNRDALDLVRV